MGAGKIIIPLFRDGSLYSLVQVGRYRMVLRLLGASFGMGCVHITWR